MEAEEKEAESSKTRQNNAGRPWWMMPKLLTDLKASCKSTINNFIYPSEQEIADLKEMKDLYDGVEESNSSNNSGKRTRGRKRKRSKFTNRKKKRKAKSTSEVKHARGTKKKVENEQQPTTKPRKKCTHKRHKRLVIRETERKLDTPFPMRDTLLKHRLLRPEMVPHFSCSCGKRCKCEKWEDECPTSEDLDWSYHSSDLRVCHYSWGSWRYEESKQ